jgi:hypothetical protein
MKPGAFKSYGSAGFQLVQPCLEGELEHALGARREGDLARHEAAAAPDDLLDLDARLLQADAET